jgi:small nuclear ribonucleoprotein B and B'
VSLTVEGPPPQEESRAKANAAAGGPGIGRAAGKLLPLVVMAVRRVIQLALDAPGTDF